MNEITLGVDNRHLSTLLMFLKTLDYIEIKKVEKQPSMSVEKDKLMLLYSLYVAWKDDQDTEAIIQDIHQHRYFNRTIERL